jgi:KaiC/GvpD/RAD55 family RecA-like ATPase
MDSAKDLITEQLSQTGEPVPASPDVVRLLQRRITPDMQLPPMEFLFNIFGTPCLPRGELVAVAGKAKSGKTFFLSLLMAAFQGKMMWYDTEQSEQSTQDILANRILPLRQAEVFPCDIVSRQSETATSGALPLAFNVRCENCEQRLRLLAAGIAYLQPDLVVLDGVRDLVSDINDGVEAQRITEQLMNLAQSHHCCIVCVLHQNKSDSDHNLRGWIGTEMTNKVFEVYSCEKLKGSATFRVEQTHTRKHEIGRQLFFTVDAQTGLPSACEQPQEQPRDALGRWTKPRQHPTDEQKWTALNQKYIINCPERADHPWEWNLRRLFGDALAGKDYLPYGKLMGMVISMANIADKNIYYDAFRQAVQQNIICEVKHPATAQQLVGLVNSQLPFNDPPF